MDQYVMMPRSTAEPRLRHWPSPPSSIESTSATHQIHDPLESSPRLHDSGRPFLDAVRPAQELRESSLRPPDSDYRRSNAIGSCEGASQALSFSGESGERQDFGPRRPRCVPCKKSFTTQRALVRHRKESSHHRAGANGGLGQYYCGHCFKSFGRAYDRKRHLEKQHGSGEGPSTTRHNTTRPTISHACVMPDTIHVSTSEDTIGPATTETPSSGPRKASDDPCDGMCFVGFGGIRRATARGRGRIDKSVSVNRVRNPQARQRIGCGICHQDFELREPQVLFSHLNRHFEDLKTSRHRCDVCEINFTHGPDLERHLNSAAKNNCGFNFLHKMPCPGHHPPTISGRKMSRESCDDDRFGFTYRVSHWERAQLIGFIRSVERMAAAKLATQDSVTNSTSAVEDNRVIKLCRAWVSGDFGPGADQAINDSMGTLAHILQSMSKGEHQLRRSRSFTEGMLTLGATGTNVAGGHSQSLELDLRALLAEFPVDISIYRRDWDSMLLRAAASGDAALMEVALANGADVNGKDANNMSPLRLAAISGSQQAVELLLSKGAIPAAARDESKEVLNFAIDTGHHQLLALLLSAGPQPIHLLQRAVMAACEKGDLRSLSLLCAHEQSLEGDDLQKFQKAVLTHASYGAIQWLLDSELQTVGQKAKILLNACRHGREDLVQLLTQRGVQIDDAAFFPCVEEHPLYIAARLQNEECLQLMLRCCTDMTEARKKEILGQASLDMLERKRLPRESQHHHGTNKEDIPPPPKANLHSDILQWTLKTLSA